jgi:hypothetical protein
MVTALMALNGCSSLKTLSPTETFQAYYEASTKRDAAAIKALLSKRTIEMMNNAALAESKKLDDVVLEQRPAKEMPATRNEKIDGDNATLEVKRDKSEEWDTLPFVKEDGAWKIAFDKFIDELRKKQIP